MKKKSQPEQNSPPDISNYFDTLNKRIDLNTNSIQSLEKQVSLILKKMNSIEQLIKQKFTEKMPKPDRDHDLSQNTDSDSDTKDKSAKTPLQKNKKPSEQFIKIVKHTSDSESEEEDHNNNLLPSKKKTKPENNNKPIVKKPPTQTKTIIKPTAQKAPKPNSPTTANRNQTSPRPKIQINKEKAKDKGTNGEEEDQNNDKEINIQEELSKSKKSIISMKKSISENMDYMNQTYICENLNAMKCFKKIKYNIKNSENDENSLDPFTINGCKYHIYAEDMQNKKFYFNVCNFKRKNKEFPTKLNNEKESFIYAKVSNSMKKPSIKYFLLINNKFKNIKCKAKQSFAKTVYEMKVKNKIIKSKGTDYDYDKDIINEEEENEDKELQIKQTNDGFLTKSTIIRKIKNIRNENDDDNEEDVDFTKELSKSRLRINNIENNLAFNIGYMGEAYAYNDLNAMKCFPEVIWNAKTSDSKNPAVYIKDGRYFHIKEDYGHFDIYAKDENNKKYYFEIKSSCNNIARDLRPAQENMSKQINQRNESFILCKVTNVLDTPVINYFLVINLVYYPIILDNGKSFVEIVEELKIEHNCYEEEEDDDDIKILHVDSSDEESDNKNDDDDDDDIDFYNLSTRNIKKLNYI